MRVKSKIQAAPTHIGYWRKCFIFSLAVMLLPQESVGKLYYGKVKLSTRKVFRTFQPLRSI